MSLTYVVILERPPPPPGLDVGRPAFFFFFFFCRQFFESFKDLAERSRVVRFVVAARLGQTQWPGGYPAAPQPKTKKKTKGCRADLGRMPTHVERPHARPPPGPVGLAETRRGNASLGGEWDKIDVGEGGRWQLFHGYRSHTPRDVTNASPPPSTEKMTAIPECPPAAPPSPWVPFKFALAEATSHRSIRVFAH